jgi:hypothetical protein
MQRWFLSCAVLLGLSALAEAQYAAPAASPYGGAITPTAPTPAGPTPALPPTGAPVYAPNCAPACAPVVSMECAAAKSIEPWGPRVWTDADFLFWWVSPASSPFPLVTTGDPAGANPGALTSPATVPLFGGNGIDFSVFTGLRVTIGGWVDEERTFGFSVEGFGLFENNRSFAFAGDATGRPPIYQPIINGATGNPGAFIIADPLGGGLGGLTGSLVVDLGLQLWGAEANALVNLYQSKMFRWDGVVGINHLNLREELGFTRGLNDFTFDVQEIQRETFRTANEFYGAQLGSRFGVRTGCVEVDFLNRWSFGVTHQTIDVFGFDAVSGAGVTAPGVFPGALYTAPTNLGSRSRDVFGMASRAQVKIAWVPINNARIFVAYDALYWNSVARPGEQVDPRINPTQLAGGTLVGPAAPLPRLHGTDIWVQGVSVGFEIGF